MPPALLIIDVQNAIDDPSWGTDRNNLDAEANMAQLLGHWRARGWPLFHIRHLSRDPRSTYRPGQPGCEFKPEVAPRPGERVIEKFTGVITNNSIEATARMSGNLGFPTIVVSDATATFGRPDYNGVWRTSEEVHAMSLANLEGEYARILSTEGVLARFGVSCIHEVNVEMASR